MFYLLIPSKSLNDGTFHCLRITKLLDTLDKTVFLGRKTSFYRVETTPLFCEAVRLKSKFLQTPSQFRNKHSDLDYVRHLVDNCDCKMTTYSSSLRHPLDQIDYLLLLLSRIIYDKKCLKLYDLRQKSFDK